jgi:KRAB domain-containing zinc finger protein
MRHSGERPYKCLYCDYSSIQSEAYKNHILSKHSKKTGSKTNVFICPQCSYKTVKAESYFNHLKEKHSKGKILILITCL